MHDTFFCLAGFISMYFLIGKKRKKTELVVPEGSSQSDVLDNDSGLCKCYVSYWRCMCIAKCTPQPYQAIQKTDVLAYKH